MFSKTAAYYDLIYGQLKDYLGEAEKLRAMLAQLDPIPRQLLDVGCGTGEHAFYLTNEFGFDVDGIDIEPGFIEIASRKNPSGDFSVADMARFSLPRKYDAILCLFSSIAYVETIEKLAATAECFANHLEPGGWLILEAWVEPDQWNSGRIDATEILDESSDTEILRTRQSDREGDVSILTIDYDIASPGGSKTISETHRLGLFTSQQLTETFANAGFSIHITEGLFGRPMYLACYTP